MEGNYDPVQWDLCVDFKRAACCVITSLQHSKAGPNLEPDGIDYLAEDEQRENPESAEDGGQDEL